MWRFASLERTLPDVERFLGALNNLNDYFDTRRSLHAGRAPGRLDLMGGIADYSGSLVLELPLGVATWVAVQASDEPFVTLWSPGASVAEPWVRLPLADLQVGLDGPDYSELRARLAAESDRAWAAYVVGVLIILQRECGVVLKNGLRLFIFSEVPAGKGVSSSAALEVATMQALAVLYNLAFGGREMALLCQRVENLLVGAPCGVMDQMTASCGEQGALLALLCQPAELWNTIVLPEEIEVWGIDSGIRHAVTGSDYGSVRVGAFMGYRIIAELAGLVSEQAGEQRVTISDPVWNGYLANIAPSLWESVYRDQVPLEMDGSAFLDRYGGSTDSITRIDPRRRYAVRQPTAHPIYEHQRVRLFRSLLAQRPVSEEQSGLLGELMYQSHASYSACGLGSSGTDRLVELVRAAGPAAGLYGAKITGGGSGGTVAILARRGTADRIEGIAASYSRASGREAEILRGSSPGAIAWGHQLLIATT